MQRLVQGIHHFQNIGFRQREELFAQLAHAQHPEALLITCADSRIVTSLITTADPGQLFIIRNVGNIVPCHGTGDCGELAAVEYAIQELGVEDVIVCGHTCCGAMKALLQAEAGSRADPGSSIRRWLRHADATRQIIRDHYSNLQGADLVNAAAEENVLVQLEHLRTVPVVASRVPAGKVRLHGWMYKIETGEIFFYDVSQSQFTKFVEPERGTRAGA